MLETYSEEGLPLGIVHGDFQIGNVLWLGGRDDGLGLNEPDEAVPEIQEEVEEEGAHVECRLSSVLDWDDACEDVLVTDLGFFRNFCTIRGRLDQGCVRAFFKAYQRHRPLTEREQAQVQASAFMFAGWYLSSKLWYQRLQQLAEMVPEAFLDFCFGPASTREVDGV